MLWMLGRGHVFAQPAADGGRPERARLTLVQELCVTRSYDPAAFSGLLQIELQSLRVELEQAQSFETLGASDPGLAIVRVGCEAADGQLQVELIDVLTGKHIQRAMLVSDIERSARPRALALLVTTTLESSWVELTMPRNTPSLGPLPESVRQRLRQRLSTWLPPSAATPPPATPAPQPEPIVGKNAIALAGTLRAFPARNTGLIGGELAVSRAFEPLRLVVNVEALFGSQELSDSYGRIGHYALRWIAGGATLLWASTLRPELSIGPFFRLGYAAAKGKSERNDYTAKDEGSVVSALGLSALLRAETSRDFDLWFGLDIGYVLNGVVFLADLSRPGGMADMTVGARLGASFEF
jgi:hypothetical protein